jgi:dipeptidyl aminopeptidase/acylaminoacyl peptidase
MLAFLRASAARTYAPVVLPIARNGEPLGEPRSLRISSCENPLWLGDGSELLCVVGDGEDRTLRRISVRENRVNQPLPSIGVLGQHLTISPGGDRLIYSNFTWEGDIWQLNLMENTAPVRLIASTVEDLMPQFSPDGKKIAFLSNRSGNLALWVAESNGASAMALAPAALKNPPSWAPDGQQIAYTCRFGQSPEDICVTGITGGTPQRLTADPARDILPSWSRDGRWVYFASDRSGSFQNWKTPADADASGPATQITRDGGFGGVESVDGKYLYYAKSVLWGAIWRVPVNGGDEAPVGEAVRSPRLPRNFAVVSDGIVFATAIDPMSRFELRKYSFSSEKVEIIAEVAGGMGNGISISPDGRSLLYTTLEVRSGDLLMVEKFRSTLTLR